MPLIKSSIRDYSFSVVDNLSSIQPYLSDNVFLIVDQQVYQLYSNLEIFSIVNQNHIITINACEEEKEFHRIGQTISRLTSAGVCRNSHLLAMGGGVIQDIVCFVAQILFRGVKWSYIPTTLLAQGDSCIGSKSSINLIDAKNQVGGFYPPSTVLINPFFLQSLNDRDYFSGLGEIAHYFCLDSPESFEFFSDSLDKLLKRTQSTIKKAILKSLSIKHQMIELDEFDRGPRLVFNYGHSFGHAIESCSQYAIPHGIAVAYGILIANQLSLNLKV